MNSGHIISLFLSIIFLSCTVQEAEEQEKIASNEAKLEKTEPKPLVSKVKIPELKASVYNDTDSVYVVNFWATWCKPCVQELPYFEKARENFSDQKVAFKYVSLDFPDILESKVIPFVEKKGYGAELLLLDEDNQNYFINAIDSSWTGAIPATLFVSGKSENKFHEGELTYEELEEIVDSMLN